MQVSNSEMADIGGLGEDLQTEHIEQPAYFLYHRSTLLKICQPEKGGV